MPDISTCTPREGELGDLPFHHEHASRHAPTYVRIPIILSSLANASPGTNDIEALEPLRSRYSQQHYALRKFYYECSNLKYLTGLINVPKLGQVSGMSTFQAQTTDFPVGTSEPLG